MSQIPPPTDPIWEKLMTGKTKHKFSLFGANMAVDRAMREFTQNSSNKLDITNELRAFFMKYESLTASELASLN